MGKDNHSRMPLRAASTESDLAVDADPSGSRAGLRAVDTEDTARSVLLVEPDPEHQVELAHALRDRGHRVVGTSSDSGALALIEQWPVDLVLVSQELPGTTGVQVAQTLIEAHPELRLVVIASEGSEGLRHAAQRSGALDCVARACIIDALDSWLSADEDAGDWRPSSQAPGLGEATALLAE